MHAKSSITSLNLQLINEQEKGLQVFENYSTISLMLPKFFSGFKYWMKKRDRRSVCGAEWDFLRKTRKRRNPNTIFAVKRVKTLGNLIKKVQ